MNDYDKKWIPKFIVVTILCFLAGLGLKYLFLIFVPGAQENEYLTLFAKLFIPALVIIGLLLTLHVYRKNKSGSNGIEKPGY